MTREQSHKLFNAVLEAADHAPAEKQVRAFEALAEVMPHPEDREACARIAFIIQESLDLRNQFSTKR